LADYAKDIKDFLKLRLWQPLPGRAGQEKMIGHVIAIPRDPPANAKPSAVLCLLFPENDKLSVLLMKRMEDHTAHSGQVSFPGGRQEPTDKSLLETALRETHEEVGINPESVEILGPLSSIYIPVSNYNVFPFVGYMPEKPVCTPSRSEVARVLEVPLDVLFHPVRKEKRDVVSPAIKKVVPQVNAYVLEDDTVIWGATAMMLSELETILAERKQTKDY